MWYLSHITANLLRGAERGGADTAVLLREADLPDCFDLSTTVSVPQFVALVRATTRALDDEALGLFDRRQRVGTFAILAAYASSAPTVGEAFARCAQFLDLQENSLSVTFKKRQNHAVFSLSPLPERTVLNELGYELVLVLLHRLVGWLGGSRIPINHAYFHYKSPLHGASYPALFGNAAVSFESSQCSLHMPSGFMNRPVLRSEEQAMAWARRTPLDAFLPTETYSGLTAEVATTIEHYLDEFGVLPDANFVSDQIGMASHTLRRRLLADGVDYRTIRNQVRRDRAIRFLNTTDHSIEEISGLTGFSEASAFIRAFKSWTGITPRHYRSPENK